MNITEVAVAIFLKPDGTFLLSSRPDGKPYAGYWEFPGGKIEAGESVRDALVRELIEELNVTITRATPWFTFMMHYTHATVRLHCWRVTEWQGEMRGMESQQFSWQSLREMTVTPTLPGCGPIFKALALPMVYTMCGPSGIGAESYPQHWRGSWSKNAPKQPSILEFESPLISPMMQICVQRYEKFAHDLTKLAQEAGARVLIGGDISAAKMMEADGIQLTASQLTTLSARPNFALVGATINTRAELEQAAKINCDFAVIDFLAEVPINWAAFADLTQATPLPCYASGTFSENDLPIALENGAHGIVHQQRETEWH